MQWQEEVVHRVEIDTPEGGDDEDQEEKEEERYRSRVADLARQWSGLELFRHGHSDLKS